jgi:hypothetical protein
MQDYQKNKKCYTFGQGFPKDIKNYAILNNALKFIKKGAKHYRKTNPNHFPHPKWNEAEIKKIAKQIFFEMKGFCIKTPIIFPNIYVLIQAIITFECKITHIDFALILSDMLVIDIENIKSGRKTTMYFQYTKN